MGPTVENCFSAILDLLLAVLHLKWRLSLTICGVHRNASGGWGRLGAADSTQPFGTSSVRPWVVQSAVYWDGNTARACSPIVRLSIERTGPTSRSDSPEKPWAGKRRVSAR